MLKTNRGFWKTFFFTLITFGIYPMYLIHAFAKETNIACKEDGKHTHGFLFFFFVSLITFGIYSIIWMVKLIDRRGQHCIRHHVNNRLTTTFYLLTIFIFAWLTLGICLIVLDVKYIHQQNDVNMIYNTSIIKK